MIPHGVRSRAEVLVLASCIFLRLALAQQPPQVPPCVDDCLAEALAADPTKGCAPGTYWLPYPRDQPGESCQPCPLGSYCPGVPYGNFTGEPVNLNRRIACPAGRWNNQIGAGSLAECEWCVPGRYNTYIGETECTDCPAGTYSVTEGSSNLADCLICPAGHHCHQACGRPIPCDAGTFVIFPGMENASRCLDCTPGHYCPIGAVEPLGCPAGSFGNNTGIAGNGQYPGTFLPDGWTDSPGTGVGGTGCSLCPAAFFCPNASIVPTQCPAGTFSEPASKAEADCVECPEGFQCQMQTSTDTRQTLVMRGSGGQPMGGSDVSEACAVDSTVLHHSFPNIKGCVEHCPYEFPRQSYCHVAGDGRVPDRTAAALRVASLVLDRGEFGLRSEEQRQAALGNLSQLLDSMTAEESLGSVTMMDSNGRTPLLMAAMMGDVPLLDVLWEHGAGNDYGVSAARDGGGFSAVMHSLLLDHADAVSWLVAKGATLSRADAEILEGRGVDIAGVPIGEVQVPAYLGRGSQTWTHPSAATFGGLPVSSPLPTTLTTSEFFTTTLTSTTATVTSTSSTTSGSSSE